MGFDMTEGVIANWLKAEGEAVNKGEQLPNRDGQNDHPD